MNNHGRRNYTDNLEFKNHALHWDLMSGFPLSLVWSFCTWNNGLIEVVKPSVTLLRKSNSSDDRLSPATCAIFFLFKREAVHVIHPKYHWIWRRCLTSVKRIKLCSWLFNCLLNVFGCHIILEIDFANIFFIKFFKI